MSSRIVEQVGDDPVQLPLVSHDRRRPTPETSTAVASDEESYYEVEVTRADGSQVDVQIDRDFGVVGSEGDSDAVEEEE